MKRRMKGKKYKGGQENERSLIFEFGFQSLAAHICFSIASLAFFISLLFRDFPSIVGSFSLMLFFAFYELSIRKRYIRERKSYIIELWTRGKKH